MNERRQTYRPEKEAIVAELRERAAQSRYFFVTGFQGLTVAATSDLRGRLRKGQSRLQVVPNRLLRQAAMGTPAEALAAGLKGDTALVTGAGDPVDAAKTLLDFSKANDKLKLRLALVEGSLLQPDDIRALAALPPRPVLLAQLLGTLQAAPTGLVRALSEKLASLVRVLQAAQDRKAQAA